MTGWKIKSAASWLNVLEPRIFAGTHAPLPGWKVKKPKLPLAAGNGDVGGTAVGSSSERQTISPVFGSVTASIAAKYRSSSRNLEVISASVLP